jgi:HEAT repeat protein
MPKRNVEADIERVSRLRDADRQPALAGLKKALADSINLVTARAAKIAAERQFRELVPDLLRAYDRLFDDALRRDPQCWGKNAIAKALTELDHRESAPYLRGARHIQEEPVWGGTEDTAQTLRGICLLGLATCSDLPRAQILRALIDAITDKEKVVRGEAVRAIAEMEGEEAALLLRIKARLGDEGASVTGQVFDCLLRLEGGQALPFVAGFLQNADENVQEEAALALGGSRTPAAIDLLLEAMARARDSHMRKILLRALSASRQPRAMEYLTALLKDGWNADASAALEALAIHRESGEIRAVVEEALKDAGSAMQQCFRQVFGK